MPGHSSRRPAGWRPSCVSWKGWSVAPHPEGTRAPVLWGCAALLPPTVARLWTPCRPGEPPSPVPGPRAAPRPRAISAGRSVHAHATTVLGRPQQEACRVRAGGPGCLGYCRYCPPAPILPRGAPPHPTWQQGFWEHRGAGRSQASSRTWSRSPQACKQQHGVQSQASRTRRGSFRCRSSTWEQSTARGHAGGSGAPRGPQPTRHAVGTAGSMRAWGARVCA